MNDTLDNWRKEIDALDRELLQILSRRMDVVKKIGKYKKKNHMQPFDKKRWQYVLHVQLALAKVLKLPKTLVKSIYTTIHEEALTIEKGEI